MMASIFFTGATPYGFLAALDASHAPHAVSLEDCQNSRRRQRHLAPLLEAPLLKQAAGATGRRASNLAA